MAVGKRCGGSAVVMVTRSRHSADSVTTMATEPMARRHRTVPSIVSGRDCPRPSRTSACASGAAPAFPNGPRPPFPARPLRADPSLPEGERPGACDLRSAPSSRRAASQCATVRGAPALCRGGPSSAKSGEIPALSRNGEAPAWGRAQTPDLGRRNQSSEEGRFVRCPIGCRIGRTSSSAYRWRMIEMFTRSQAQVPLPHPTPARRRSGR